MDSKSTFIQEALTHIERVERVVRENPEGLLRFYASYSDADSYSGMPSKGEQLSKWRDDLAVADVELRLLITLYELYRQSEATGS